MPKGKSFKRFIVDNIKAKAYQAACRRVVAEKLKIPQQNLSLASMPSNDAEFESLLVSLEMFNRVVGKKKYLKIAK